MKEIIWSPTTEQHVLDKHQIHIADLALAMMQGGVRAVLPMPQPARYPGQVRYIVQMHGEIYVVPVRETDTQRVLITAWPDRRLRRRYLR